ncbi:MAG: hypothetical protein ACK4TA_05730 [Saprospiraceae bacterium]
MNPNITLLICVVALLFVACQSDKKPDQTQQPNTPMPVQTAAVQHFVCPNNCPGSGGPESGTCPSCGMQYRHNEAFHNQPGAATSNTQLAPSPILTNPQQVTPQQTPQVQTVQTPQTQEPAQNAAGVWHYICSKGCEGGSGTRGMCAKCGAGLDHNQAYHVQ